MDKENSLINIDLSVGLTIEQVNERKEKGLVNKTKKVHQKHIHVLYLQIYLRF